MPYIGIDFGTSNSVVANFQFGKADVVPNHEGQLWTPSVVTLRRDGDNPRPRRYGETGRDGRDSPLLG